VHLHVLMPACSQAPCCSAASVDNTFNRMQIIQAVESYIVASLQFLQGLLHSYELLATMREHRDRFIANLLVDLAISHASKLAHESALTSLILVRPWASGPVFQYLRLCTAGFESGSD
jgi:hypothetical protein